MAMASRSAFLPSSTLFQPMKPKNHMTSFNSCSLLHMQNHLHNRHSSLQAVASSLSIPINADYLEQEFSGHGVSFESIGDSCVAKMRLDNGSIASLMLPSGLITSYKPQMWHGGAVEMLHTTVSEGEDGAAVIKGGVSMDFKCTGDGELPWSLGNWVLNDVRGSSESFVQVELRLLNAKNMVEIKCLVTLQEDVLGSELTITNTKASPLQLLGNFLSHLKVSTPDATYAVGMQGSNYHCQQPVVSKFGIIPPNFNQNRSTDPSKPWVPKARQELFSAGKIRDGKDETKQNEEETEDIEGEEKDDYSQLTEEMSRIYTSAPRNFTIIDRGRRNSVVVQRNGFDEIYVFSPGSQHEWYGNYAYVCLGPSAILTPIVLGPGDVWTGSQYLYNPSH